MSAKLMGCGHFHLVDIFHEPILPEYEEAEFHQDEPETVHVFLLHGIRSRSDWWRGIEALTHTGRSGQFLIKPVPISYKRVGIGPWLLGIGQSRRLKLVTQRFEANLKGLNDAKKTLICHSNGTHVFSQLSENIKTQFDVVFLTGSVCHFDDDERLRCCRTIINDCGVYDPVPSIAQAVRPRTFGQTGVTGFCNAPIVDRFFRFSHSGAKSNKHFEKWMKSSVCYGNFANEIPNEEPLAISDYLPSLFRYVFFSIVLFLVFLFLRRWFF